MSPFDFIKSINSKTELEPWDDKDYNAFIVNKGFSFFTDTILLANQMNLNHLLDPHMQYDFYFGAVRKRKRFSEWFKQTKDEDLELIQKSFGYSLSKARSARQVLSDQDILNIRKVNESLGGVEHERNREAGRSKSS